MGELLDYAKRELGRIGDDEYSIMIKRTILELVEVFENQDHSEYSASQVISMVSRLFQFKPITPIMGTDDEWNKVNNNTYQNKRLSSLFKETDKDGNIISIHDNDAVILSTTGGVNWFSCIKGDKFTDPITFPYNPPIFPKKVYVKELENGEFEEITDIEEIKQCAVEYLTKFDKEKVIK